MLRKTLKVKGNANRQRLTLKNKRRQRNEARQKRTELVLRETKGQPLA